MYVRQWTCVRCTLSYTTTKQLYPVNKYKGRSLYNIQKCVWDKRRALHAHTHTHTRRTRWQTHWSTTASNSPICTLKSSKKAAGSRRRHRTRALHTNPHANRHPPLTRTRALGIPYGTYYHTYLTVMWGHEWLYVTVSMLETKSEVATASRC